MAAPLAAAKGGWLGCAKGSPRTLKLGWPVKSECSVAAVLCVIPGVGEPFLMAARVRMVAIPEADRRELHRRSGAEARRP